jgi:O-antigen/teichoic acid export membrane protein
VSIGPASEPGTAPPPTPRLSRASRLVRRLESESLLRNGLYIMGTTAVTSLLGFGFWIVAARVLSVTEVGRAAALVSAMVFVAVFTNLGVGQVFVSRLASRAAGRDWSLTVTTGLALVTIVSLVVGAVAAFLLPTLIPALKGGLGAGAFLLLPIGVAAAACSVVLDFACIAERHAKLAFIRNTVAAILRVAVIGVAALGPLDGTTWILAIWAGSFLLIDVFAVTRALPSLGHEFRLTMRGWKRELAQMRGLIAGHQSINVGAQASTYLLPVLVSARLGVTENAYFYITFMLSSALFFIAPAISNALFAEGAHAPEHLGENLRRAIKYILLLAGPPAAILVVAGPAILGLFGPAYADEGGTLLLILVGAAVFDSVLQLALAVLRVRHRLREAAAATWAMLIVAVGATWVLLPPLGLEGAGVGWAIGKAVGMVLALSIALRVGGGEGGRHAD